MNWKKVVIDGQTYLSKCIIEDKIIVKFYLSDLKCVWKELCTVEEVLSRARSQNKRIEYDDDTILSTIVDSPAEISFHPSPAISELVYKYYVLKRPFNFKWELLACDQEEYVDLITNPLLLSLSSLAKQNSDLIEIIGKKDLEIEQYKLEGASLKRYKLITEKFDPVEYQKNLPFKPLAEFVTYADEKFDSILNSNKGYETNSLAINGVAVQTQSGQINKPKQSPKSKKNSAYRTHIQHIQQKLDMTSQKVHYDDSDSSTPSAISDIETKRHQNKQEANQNETSPLTSSKRNKKLKLSRKKINL